MSNKNDSRTKAFGTVQNNKGFKSPKSRQKFVIAIFIVIILILASLATLIVSKVVDRLNQTTQPTTPPPADNTTTVPYDPDDIKIGNLLVVDKANQFDYKTNGWDKVDSSDVIDYSSLPNNLKNVWAYKNDPAYNPEINKYTKISVGGKMVSTYHLGTYATSTVLEETTLLAFNRMMMDYCTQLGLDSVAENRSASDLVVAWGWSDAETLVSDVANDTKPEFYDHATGMSISLRYYDVNAQNNVTLTEGVFKANYKWIYDNAHKYGFIVRYPENCNCERSFDESQVGVRLRYVGYEHAYYIKTNNLCLEEYITLLRDHHKASGDHLTFTADNGKTYEVYYVALSGKPTSIPVPTDKEYYVSGDNMNGFIVTVTQ